MGRRLEEISCCEAKSYVGFEISIVVLKIAAIERIKTLLVLLSLRFR